MLRPSYTELMNILNEDSDFDNKITSRYSIVIAVAKRARQIIDGAQIYSDISQDKAVSVAVDEMNNRSIKTFPDMNNIPEAYLPIVSKFYHNEKPERESEKRREKTYYKRGFESNDNDLPKGLGILDVSAEELDLELELDLDLAEILGNGIHINDDAMEIDDFDEPDDFPDDLSEDLLED